ncbi:MAG: hypothetical protein KDD45_17220 [Bdellovibrionales bacterium]|nr:hypothetical protein [Bdellovibrionales bacterium]
MIIGPRKWFSKNSHDSRSYTIHDYQFQWKYIGIFSAILAIAFAGATLPIIYIYGKNYAIFEKLAFDLYPGLVENLYQEKDWLWLLFGLSAISLIIFSLYFSFKFTKKILSPIHQVEDHLHQMMIGNWIQPIDFDESKEDFKSLKVSYDYFYRTLKANTEMELTLLKKIIVDPHNRDSFLAWKNLVETKAQRIGLNPDEIINGNMSIGQNPLDLNFKVKNRRVKAV